jgi:hypothetical protein
VFILFASNGTQINIDKEIIRHRLLLNVRSKNMRVAHVSFSMLQKNVITKNEEDLCSNTQLIQYVLVLCDF